MSSRIGGWEWILQIPKFKRLNELVLEAWNSFQSETLSLNNYFLKIHLIIDSKLKNYNGKLEDKSKKIWRLGELSANISEFVIFGQRKVWARKYKHKIF